MVEEIDIVECGKSSSPQVMGTSIVVSTQYVGTKYEGGPYMVYGLEMFRHKDTFARKPHPM